MAKKSFSGKITGEKKEGFKLLKHTLSQLATS
jgi:hypothetical protein